jgi:hypothetical protein
MLGVAAAALISPGMMECLITFWNDKILDYWNGGFCEMEG